MISIIPGSFNLSFTIIELKLETASIELIGGLVVIITAVIAFVE